MDGQGEISGLACSTPDIAVTRAAVARLKNCVSETGPDAFMTINSPQEAQRAGPGFHRF